jgi:hypothetical protein
MFGILLTAAAWGMDRCELQTDVDGDGLPEIVRVAGGGEEGPLIAEGPKGQWQIDHHAVTRECYSLSLFGRKGIATISHGMAIRFYEPGPAWGTPWTYFDLYTFYTASWQGGLIQADIDGDNLPDLFCGNYWIRNPGSRELPWRLFAINVFHEHPLSASAQLHWDPKARKLLWVESRRPQGRVVWFRPPKDIRQLWLEQPHPLNRKLDCPQLRIANGEPTISASTNRCL